ncbi:MAG: hypothetical protein WBV94_33380 [Blastocatellia bacterium]
MKFQQLELLFATTWYLEHNIGDLRLVGRLVAESYLGLPAELKWHEHHPQLELLEKNWQQENGQFVPVWRQRCVDISKPDVERLVDHIRAVWVEGRPPQVIFEPTANTAYTGIVVTVHLDGLDCVLRALPADTIEGPDRAAVKGLLDHLTEIARADRPHDSAPISVTNVTQELTSPSAFGDETTLTQESSGGYFRKHIYSIRFPYVPHDTIIRVANIWKQEAPYRPGELDYYIRLAHPTLDRVLADFLISEVFSFWGKDYLILYVMDDFNDPPDSYHTVVKIMTKQEVKTLINEEFSTIESYMKTRSETQKQERGLGILRNTFGEVPYSTDPPERI